MAVTREEIENLPGFAGWHSFGDIPGASSTITYENALIGCWFARTLTRDEESLVRRFLAQHRPQDDSYLWDGSQDGWKLEAHDETTARGSYQIVREVGARRSALLVEDEDEHERIVARMIEAGVPVEFKGRSNKG